MGTGIYSPGTWSGRKARLLRGKHKISLSGDFRQSLLGLIIQELGSNPDPSPVGG